MAVTGEEPSLSFPVRESQIREEQLIRQHAAFAQYVAWATEGKGLPADALAAAERELSELAGK